MSKFGSDDGSNSNGPKRGQVTVDGFRLDSSQSSWLMDRLGALDEEDKMSMANAAPQVQMSDHDPRSPHSQQANYPQQGQASQNPSHQNSGHQNPGHQNSGHQNSGHQNSGHQNLGHPGDIHAQGNSQRPERPSQQKSSLQVHRSVKPEGPRQHYLVDGQAETDAESESALLLRQKIENLEQQLAEISDLTGDQRARYIQELTEPMGHEGGSASDYLGEPGYEGEGVSGAHIEHYDPHVQEGEAGNYDHASGVHSSGEVYQPEGYHEEHSHLQHGNEAYATPDHYQGGQSYYDEGHDAHQGAKHTGHAQLPQTAHMHQASPPQEFAELPQFLVPIEERKSSRSTFVRLIGGGVALVVLGGVAFTYFDTGVSDVVKSDILGSGKEPLKLSESKEITEEKVEPKTAALASDLSITKKFAVQSLKGSAGQTLPLKVQLPSDERLATAFLVVRNLPEWAKLNVGRQMNGLWMVSASQVGDIKIKIPDDQPGEFSFEVDLVVNAGDAPVTKKVNADIAPYQAPKPKIVETPVETVAEPEAKQEVAAIDPQVEDAELIKQPEAGVKQGGLIIDQALEEKWLERGTRLLRAGDVSAARLAFSHLAEQGSGRAALAMGMTFDPNQPSSRVVTGIKVDVERAKFWYQRALSLGHEGARDPLRQLEREKK